MGKNGEDGETWELIDVNYFMAVTPQYSPGPREMRGFESRLSAQGQYTWESRMTDDLMAHDEVIYWRIVIDIIQKFNTSPHARPKKRLERESPHGGGTKLKELLLNDSLVLVP